MTNSRLLKNARAPGWDAPRDVLIQGGKISAVGEDLDAGGGGGLRHRPRRPGGHPGSGRGPHASGQGPHPRYLQERRGNPDRRHPRNGEAEAGVRRGGRLPEGRGLPVEVHRSRGDDRPDAHRRGPRHRAPGDGGRGSVAGGIPGKGDASAGGLRERGLGLPGGAGTPGPPGGGRPHGGGCRRRGAHPGRRPEGARRRRVRPGPEDRPAPRSPRG